MGAGLSRRPRPVASAAAHEAAGNRAVAGLWDRYESHRRRLTATVLSAPGASGRLCLLGAGNCLDVDLAALAAVHDEVHLVDLDGAALARARKRQPAEVRPKLHLHAPVDLAGGFCDEARRWSRGRPTLVELRAVAERAGQEIAARLPGPFDRVISCCLLTQLDWALARTMGADHPARPEAVEALVRLHLHTLAALGAPRGGAVLATELASDEDWPLDELDANVDLGALVPALLAAGAHFAAAHPPRLRRLLRRDDHLARAFDEAAAIAPWLWRGALDRTYLVYALVLRRRG